VEKYVGGRKRAHGVLHECLQWWTLVLGLWDSDFWRSEAVDLLTRGLERRRDGGCVSNKTSMQRVVESDGDSDAPDEAYEHRFL
jgi:hypothetical protein